MGSNMAECHPVGFRFVMQAKLERGEGHPRRPAVHPHLGHGRHLRPAPRGHRHRLPRRPDPLRPRGEASSSSDYVVAYTNAATLITERSRTPRTSTACSRASTPSARSTTRGAGGTTPSPASGPANQPVRELNDASTFSARGGKLDEPAAAPTRRCRTRAASSRSSAATTPATRPRWSSRSAARPRETFLKVAETLWQRLGARPDRRRSATPSAGPSTRPACRRSAPRRSSSSCSATSAGPAAASWPCAATPRSRARPTSPRSTTSSPAT